MGREIVRHMITVLCVCTYDVKVNVLSVFPSVNLTQRWGPGREQRKTDWVKNDRSCHRRRGLDRFEICFPCIIIKTLFSKQLSSTMSYELFPPHSQFVLPRRRHIFGNWTHAKCRCPPPLILSLLSQLTYNANELRFVCFAFAFVFLCPLSLLLRIAGFSCPLCELMELWKSVLSIS